VRRTAARCIDFHWKDLVKKPEYFYFQDLALYYPRYQKNTNCIKSVYNQVFWDLDAEYRIILANDVDEDGDDFAVALFGGLLAAMLI
jgi:hypothetical protein